MTANFFSLSKSAHSVGEVVRSVHKCADSVESVTHANSNITITIEHEPLQLPLNDTIHKKKHE